MCVHETTCDTILSVGLHCNTLNSFPHFPPSCVPLGNHRQGPRRIQNLSKICAADPHQYGTGEKDFHRLCESRHGRSDQTGNRSCEGSCSIGWTPQTAVTRSTGIFQGVWQGDTKGFRISTKQVAPSQPEPQNSKDIHRKIL
jgi:hypothetical protein